MMKRHMSLIHPMSLQPQPPKIHATLSASVTVCARKPEVGEPIPDGSLTPIHHWRRRHLHIQRIRQTRYVAKPGVQLIGPEYTRQTWRRPRTRQEARSNFALALGVERQRTVLLVGNHHWQELSGANTIAGEEYARGSFFCFFFARSVEVDAEREFLDPFGHGEGRESERDALNRSLAETRGVRRRSSSAGRDMLR